MRLRNLIETISGTLVMWQAQWTHRFQGNVQVDGSFSANGVSGSGQAASVGGAGLTITPNGAGLLQITCTTNNAFTLAAPSGTFRVGARIVIEVINHVGGAMGTITFNAAYIKSAFTNPADTKAQVLEFIYDGANWIQLSPAGVDIG